jgi:hypothetical protein
MDRLYSAWLPMMTHIDADGVNADNEVGPAGCSSRGARGLLSPDLVCMLDSCVFEGHS